MSDKEVVETLIKLAKKDKALNDVLDYFSGRERSRYVITLKALNDSMVAHKYKNPRSEYGRVLGILAQYKVGTAERDSMGRVKALSGIRVSIPSLGKAVKEAAQLEEREQRNRYRTIDPKQVEAAVPTEPEAHRVPRPGQSPSTGTVITFQVGDTYFSLPIPKGASPKDVAKLMARLQGDSGEV